VTRLGDRVLESGLVVRENRSSDRRSIHVALTPPGREVFERAIAAHVESIGHHVKTPPEGR
jgi:DNA-binding MarR family transcriptional regulator